MEAKFSLRKQSTAKAAKSIITLQVFDARFPGRKFFYSTGVHIRPDEWKKSQKAGQENDPVNIHLENLAEAVKAWGKTKTGSTTLLRADLRKHLDNVGKDERKEQEQQLQKEVDLFKIWRQIIDTTKGTNGEKISDNTRLSKNQTLNLVTRYCLEKGLKLSFENIDMEFYHAFDSYMDSQGLSPNSKGKHVKEIKSILREAQDRDIKVNNSFQKKSFKVIRKDTDNTYLTEDELKRMLQLKLNPAKTALRDIFVMACFVGVRHSDWHQIRKANIITEKGRDYLKIKQKKTTGSITVPVHPIVRILLNKYDGNPPRVISNQKFNEGLKEICKHEDLKLGSVILNGKSVDKADKISTHSARRSFATNAYLSKSMQVHSIMDCTGHKTEASFLKYLKLSGLDKAQDIAESKFFNDAGWTNLKVA